MYLGVVGNPIPSKEFDGKIFIQRVSETIKYKQMTHNQNFSDEAGINGLIRRGAWYSGDAGFIVDGMTLGDLRISLVENYQLEEDVAARVVIKYYTGRSTNNKKVRYVVDDDATLPTQDAFNMNGHTLVVRMEKNDEREVDTTCDSTFMEKMMPEIGKAIREKYHWVSRDVPIFLFLDNAGGHGTNEAVTKYPAPTLASDEHAGPRSLDGSPKCG